MKPLHQKVMYLLLWMNELQALHLHDNTDERFSVLLRGERGLLIHKKHGDILCYYST